MKLQTIKIMAIIIGPKFLFGKLDPKPARGFPSPVVEFLIDQKEFVIAKCEGKTYAVKDTGEHWEPAQEICFKPNTELIQVETRIVKGDEKTLVAGSNMIVSIPRFI